MTISAAEKQYIKDGCQLNYRNDGRYNDTIRCIDVDNDYIKNALGGVSYKIPNCAIIVAINGKVENSNSPGICANVTLSPSAMMNSSDLEYDEIYLQSRIEEYLSIPSVIDHLRVFRDILSWKLFVDVLVLSCDGSVLDHISNAILVAFKNLRLPRIKPVLKILTKSKQEWKHDFDIDTTISDPMPLNVLNQLPVVCTSGDIRGTLVWDMTAAEELCTHSQYQIVISRSKIYSFNKSGTQSSNTHISDVKNIYSHAEGLGIELLNKLLEGV